MNYFKITKLLFGLFILITNIAIAQQPKLSEAKKKYALGAISLHTAKRMVGHMKDTCEKYFPQFRQQNNAAYNDWSAKYKSFHVEIDNHYVNAIGIISDLENISTKDAQENRETILLAELKAFSDKLARTGDSYFGNWCKKYPIYTNSAISDLEKHHTVPVNYVRDYKN